MGLVRRRGRWRAAALALTAAAAFVVSPAHNASADDYGYSNLDGQGPVQLYDSDDHWFCFHSSVESGWRGQYRSAMAYLDDTTRLYDVETGTCGDLTDVVFFQLDIGSGIRGVAPCQQWAYWSVCDRTSVVVNAAEIYRNTGTCGGGQPRFDVNFVQTTRHELGHTVGLHHTPSSGSLCGPPAGNDAMTSDFTPTSLSWTDYNQHHVDHVNCICG